MSEKWVVGQPGGPSGPFYSVVASTGKAIALQVPDGKMAAKIAQIPELEAQDRRLVSDLRQIRDLVAQSDGEVRQTLSTLNFWISIYDRDNDGL